MPTLGRPPQPLLLHAEGLEGDVRRRWARTPLVVSRALCRLRWFPLAHVPLAERADALRVQAAAWQPFDEGAASLVIRGEEGLAVAWDARVVREALADTALAPERCSVWPEVLMRPPGDDGPRLLRLPQGVEAQVWQAGWLRASRWWPQAPTPEAWRLFTQSLSGEAAQWPMPRLDEAPGWLSKPWAVPLADQAQDAAQESRVVGWAVAALVFSAAWVGAQWWQAERALQSQQQANADMRARLGPVLTDRDAALQRSAEAAQWSQWLTAPVLPVEVMEGLHEALAKRQVVLKELDWRGDKLRVGLQVPAALPRSDLLRGFQTVPQFSNPTEVRVENGRDLVWLDMGLRAPTALSVPGGPDAARPGMDSAPTGTAPPAAAATPAATLATSPPPAAPTVAAPAPASTVARPAPKPAGAAPAAAPPRPQFNSNPKPIAMAASGEDFPPQSVFDAVK
jgi:hypothetical protein